MEFFVVILIIIGIVVYLSTKTKQTTAEIEQFLKTGQIQAQKKGNGKFRLIVMPKIFTPLRILKLRHKRFRSESKAQRLNLPGKYAYIAHNEYYNPDRVWTDVGVMYDEGALEQYFSFLEQVRMIVEDNSLSADVKINDIIFTCKQKQRYKQYFIKLNEEYGSFPACIFYKGLTKVNGIGDGTAESLYNEGILSMDELQNASDSDLLKVPGVGKKTIKQIRNYFNNRIEL